MPDNYSHIAYDASGAPKFGYDGKQWVPYVAPEATPGAFQTQPGGVIQNANQPQENPLRAIPRTFLESFGVDVDKVESAKSYLAAAKGAGGDVSNAVGEGMFNSLMKAGPLAPVHMMASVIDGAAKGIENGSKKAFDSYKTGDKYGLYQGLTQVASAMAQIAMMKVGEEPIKKSTEFGAGLVRKTARMPVGIGANMEATAQAESGAALDKYSAENKETAEYNANRVAEAQKDHADAKKSIDDDHAQKLREVTQRNTLAVSEGRQNHETAVRKINEAHAEATTEHAKKIADLDKDYANGVDLRKRVVGTKARLMNWSDQIGDIVDKTRDNIVEHFNQRYDAFRQSLGPNPEVNWTPMQLAVAYAKDHLLTGSPESISIFNNIMKEGPQLDEDLVARTSQRLKASENLKAMMIGKDLDAAAKARMEAALHDQGAPAAEQSSIPHKDAWGFVQELEGKIAGRQWPSDVYRALRYVADEGQKQLLETAEKAKKGTEWKALQADYANFKNKFDEPKSPASGIREARNSEVKSGIISGTNGQELSDILTEFRQFSPDKQIIAKLKNLRAALKNLPNPTKLSTPEYPEVPVRNPDPNVAKLNLEEPPSKKAYPEGPDYKGTKEPPDRPRPFSPDEWRAKRLKEFQERMGGRQPGTMWQTAQLPFFRGANWLYSNPAFVKLILGIK